MLIFDPLEMENALLYYYLPIFYSVAEQWPLASRSYDCLLLCYSVKIRFVTAMGPT
jgi:hypothetical protein